MYKTRILFIAMTFVLIFVSCSSKLDSLSSDCFKVVPNPLETDAGKVTATINGVFPEKYMKKKAVIKVTPELRFGAGLTEKGAASTFQGESVQGNAQSISYRVGGNYTMRTTFDYDPQMHKSELYATFNATVGKKKVDVPAVKIADGIIATSELYRITVNTAKCCMAQDKFQRVTSERLDANVKFLIQQAELRKSEMQNNSVQEFVSLLQRISADREGFIIDDIDVSAYASPDGGLDLNEKLANKRGENTEQYVNQLLKKVEVEADVNTKYTAEDWEGFQELVAASDIQDKDVILRVLSMYKDPEEREQQIKNMSSAFTELADGILPELRRARLTINYEVIGRDDAQIEQQLKDDPAALSLEELLYSATLTDDLNEQKSRYNTVISIYPQDARAYNNIAAIEYCQGNYTVAEQYVSKALLADPSCPEANATKGLLALRQGDVNTAETYIAKGNQAYRVNETIGNLHLAQGNYAQAANDFKGVYSNSAVLSQILTKDYAEATKTLANIKQPDATTDYLTAILNARQGNNSAATIALRSAIEKDSSWSSYASNDLELLEINK